MIFSAKKNSIFLSICGLILSGAAISVCAQNKINVRVFAETKIETDTIKLGDIAQISGDVERVERLKIITLGYAPNVGMTRELTREKILLAINAAGFSSGEFLIIAAPTIRIFRAGQTITQAQMRGVIEKAVADLFAGETVATKILRVDLPLDFDVPTGNIKISVNLSTVRNYFSAFAAPLEIRINDAVVRRVTATVEIEAFADVLIAVKNLAPNEKIAADCIRLENRRLTKPLENYFQDAKDLRGTRLIKNVPNGAEITKDSLVADTVIKFGDTVRIVGESGKIQLSVLGEARANGRIGDRIAVKNSQSNAVLQAVVVDEGLVKIVF